MQDQPLLVCFVIALVVVVVYLVRQGLVVAVVVVLVVAEPLQLLISKVAHTQESIY